MALLNLEYNLIGEDSVQFLGQNTKITYLNPGSKARTILDIVNDKMSRQAAQLESNTGKAFLRFSEGRLLEYIGEVFGVERELAERARVVAQESNLYLYTIQPSFGSINNGADIVIERGALSFYDNLDPTKRKAIYHNTKKIVLPANERKVYFDSEAIGFGADYNVGSGTLVFHAFTGYTDARNGTLLISNESPITYGRDDESDNNLKYRIRQRTLSSEAANDLAIRIALSGVAGVSEVIKVKYPRGIGTADWIIKAVTLEVSQFLLNSCQDAIENVQAEGTENIAVAPVTVGISMNFYLVYVAETDIKGKNEAKQEVRTSVTNYVNGLDIGEKLVIDQLVRVILSSSSRIESMGLPSETENFERLSVHKRSSFDDSIIKRDLLADYVTRYNERVIMEPSLDEPITIKDYN